MAHRRSRIPPSLRALFGCDVEFGASADQVVFSPEVGNFPVTNADPYLNKLRTTYKLDELVAGKNGDYEKVQAVCHWVRSRWEHNGNNEPKKNDAISILQEAEQGKRFRCVEYSVVLGDSSPLELQSFALRELFDELVISCEPAIEAKNLRLQTSFDSALDEVSGKPLAVENRNSKVESGNSKIENRHSVPTIKVRARFRSGILYPLEDVDLPDGAEVEILLRPTSKS